MFNWIAQLGWSRGLSLLIAVAYALTALLIAQTRSIKEFMGLVLPVIALAIPLACIWFGDELGGYIGTLPGPAINKTSPGWMIKIAGWFLLLMPVIVLLYFSARL